MLTLSAVAENKQIALDSLAVNVHRSTEDFENMSTIFSVDVQLPTDLSDREKVLLFNAARKCDVKKIFEGEMQIQYQLIES